MMHNDNGPTLYDVGYKSVGEHLDLLMAFMQAKNAVLVDIRHKPYSKIPTWRDNHLKKLLETSYVHIPELGNRNYHLEDGPIDYVNLDAGINRLSQVMYLRKKSVIVMCACWNRDKCHRVGVVKAFEKAYYGQESVSITLEMLKGFATQDEPKQSTLF